MKRKNFALVLLLTVIFLLGLGVFFLSVNRLEKQNTAEVAQQAKEEADTKVLGRQTNYPQIFISGGDGRAGRGGVVSLASTDEPAIQVASYGVSGTAQIDIYKADKNALLNYLVHDAEGNQINKNVDTADFELIGSTSEQINADYNKASKVILPIGESGVWYISIKLGEIREDAFVVRSNTGTLVKEGEDELIFWGQDFKTLRSVSSGNVIIYNLQGRVSEISNVSFNDEGIARSNLTVDADVGIIHSGSDISLIPINLRYLNEDYFYNQFQAKDRQARFFIFTDRPVYKPGDKVYFKAVVRDDDDARYTIPTGVAQVKVYDGRGDGENPVLEKNFSITDDGTVFGEFDLPVDSLTGYYTLSMDLSPGSNNYNLRSYAYFQVEHFRKPEYEIGIATAQTEYISQDKSSFTLSGSYFFGQPLANQRVKYKIYSSDFYEYAYLVDKQNALDDEYRYGYRWGKAIKEGSAILDNKGEAQVDLDFKIPDDVYKSQIFSIEAEFDDGSGNPAFARKNVLVYSGEYGIFREDRNYNAKVGAPTSLRLKLVSRRSADLSNVPLTAKVERTTWVEYQEADKKYPSYREEKENLPNLTAVTDNNGGVSFDFTPKNEGSYKITVEGADSKNNRIIKDFYLWASRQGKPLYTGINQGGLTIQPDKEKYSHADVARLTITSEISDRDVFLSLERARVSRFKVVKINGKTSTVDIPLAETDMPNVFAKASSFSKQFLDSDVKNLDISTDPKKLVVSATPDKKSYGPGETVTVNVSTTDIKGKPVSADAAVWVVDKALFELVKERPQTIFDAFWSQRYDQTPQTHSLQGINIQRAGGGGGCFASDTQVLMAGNQLKEIKDIKVGDRVLTRKNMHDSSLVEAKVTDVHKREVSGYFILNQHLKITPNHRLLINGVWDEASKIQLGDVLTTSDNGEEVVSSIEWQDGKFEVYNLDVEKYHTYFAGGVWVHNQKGGGGRSIFKDTAYWNPSVHTDSDGQAQIRFKLPDNLTTWVLSSVGSTFDTKVGQIKEELVVTKKIVIRPVLPNIIRSGDELILSALVQNFTDDSHLFEIGLEADSVAIDSAPVWEEKVESAGIKQVYWKIKPSGEKEEAKFTFFAKASDSDDLSDRVTVKLPIKKFGFWEKWGENADGNAKFLVNLDEDSDRNKSKIALSLSPTLFGSLPTAMKYLVDYPYGCVEQTTSRFVPAVIAKSNPQFFGQVLADKEVDDIIEKGVIRLAKYQKPDGGWTWWYSGASDPFITSYVIEYLLKADGLGVGVNKEIFSQARNFLEKGAYYNKEVRRMQPTSNQSNVARKYGLTLLNSDKAKSIQVNMDELSPDLLALAIMANIKQGDNNPDTNGLSKLLSMAKTQGDETYWEAGESKFFGSQDSSTALALRAILASGGNDDVAIRASRHLVRRRKVDYWSNTFGTAQVIQAASDFVNNISELSPNYSYVVKLDGKEIAQGAVNNSEQIIKEIEISASQLSKSGSELTVEKFGKSGQLYSTLMVEEFHTDKNAKALSEGLTVKREYVSEKGDDYTLGVGDMVTVKLIVSGLSSAESYGVVSDELPAGMVPVNPVFKNEQFNQESSMYSHGVSGREVTENGMVLSLYKINPGTQVYTYKARVVSEGEFVIPPATASLMYAPEIRGRSEVQHIKINKESRLIPKKVAEKATRSLFANRFFLAGVGMLLVGAGVAVVVLRRRRIKVTSVEEKT